MSSCIAFLGRDLSSWSTSLFIKSFLGCTWHFVYVGVFFGVMCCHRWCWCCRCLVLMYFCDSRCRTIFGLLCYWCLAGRFLPVGGLVLIIFPTALPSLVSHKKQIHVEDIDEHRVPKVTSDCAFSIYSLSDKPKEGCLDWSRHSPPTLMQYAVVLNTMSAELSLSMRKIFTKLLATWALTTTASLCGWTSYHKAHTWVPHMWGSYAQQYLLGRRLSGTSFFFGLIYWTRAHPIWWSQHEIMGWRNLWPRFCW